MGGFSTMHWIVVALVILVLFGRGKISETMGDFGRGIKSFKKGIADEDAPPPAAPPPQIGQSPAAPEERTAASETVRDNSPR